MIPCGYRLCNNLFEPGARVNQPSIYCSANCRALENIEQIKDRYKNDPVAREKQKARVAAWRAKKKREAGNE